ncbi:hypothetical protein RA210_U10411 [Rubrivivax sp. A210]|uniref:JAB domain-containing protein n=1 Tax=Rubrivivax sp. A210 TaxID=2772301 RepID=UPI001918184A|nr:DNA repair protein RadC [Rubrivivax sp. A210]CAD5366610.1 hypothetical protein RA210_U10411 [Rubrivivax sp. A210]
MHNIPVNLSDSAIEDLLLVGARAVTAKGTLVCNEVRAPYKASPERRAAALSGLLQCANELLRRQAFKNLHKVVMNTPDEVANYLQIHFRGYEVEAFVVVFLNAQSALIAVEEMFRGTLTQTSVYPREIVKRALALNAGAVILAHNHPSGLAEPSRADEYLTSTLKTALGMVDVRVLDHFIVAQTACTSFAQRGLL